jgi:hypothetical protein
LIIIVPDGVDHDRGTNVEGRKGPISIATKIWGRKEGQKKWGEGRQPQFNSAALSFSVGAPATEEFNETPRIAWKLADSVRAERAGAGTVLGDSLWRWHDGLHGVEKVLHLESYFSDFPRRRRRHSNYRSLTGRPRASNADGSFARPHLGAFCFCSVSFSSSTTHAKGLVRDAIRTRPSGRLSGSSQLAAGPRRGSTRIGVRAHCGEGKGNGYPRF